jgi:DNA-binding transcriptional LysR family regulator
MTLDPRQLQVFLAIVELGSLGRAAEKLCLSQPALSRLIKRMEEQLRVQLFERTAAGMELTTFGEALLPYASRLTQEAQAAVEEINLRLGLGKGLLRIGTVASAAVVVLPRVLDELLTKWPNLRIEILEAVEDKLASDLAKNEIDVVLSGPLTENDDVMKVGASHYVDRSVVIAAASHPLAQRKAVKLVEVLALPWVMPHDDAKPRKAFDDLVMQSGAVLPHVVIETRSTATIKAVVAQTQVLGWLPEPLFAAEAAAGQICALPVKELVSDRHFFIYRRRRNFLPPPLTGLLEILRR